MFTDTELEAARQLTETVRRRYADVVPATVGGRVLLTLAHHATRLVTVGAIDDDARHAFTYGQCHAYAYALTMRTGWPLVHISNVECAFDEDCAEYPEEWGWCGCQVLHLACLRPDGLLQDIAGPRLVTDVLAEYSQDGTYDPDAPEVFMRLADERMVAWTQTHHTWRRPEVGVALTFVDATLAPVAA